MKKSLTLLKIFAVLAILFFGASLYWEHVYKDGIFILYQAISVLALIMILNTIGITKDVIKADKEK